MAAEPQVHPGRRTAGFLIGGIAILAAGGTAAVLANKKTAPQAQAGAPAQVTGVALTATDATTATVSWQAVATSGAVYTVQHTDASGNTVKTPMGALAASVTTGSANLVIPGLTPGYALHLTVTACVQGGSGTMAQVCGVPSTVASVTMAAPTLPQVTGVTATATSDTTATLSWNAVGVPSGMSGTISYTVQHTDASGTAVTTPMGSSPATVTTANTSIGIAGLTPGYALHFDVQACLTY